MFAVAVTLFTQRRGRGKQTLGCIYLWLHENARVIIKCCLRLGRVGPQVASLLAFFFLWCTRYSRMQLCQAAFHPSFLIFLLSFFFFWACHFAGESWLGPWGVCAIFLRPNVAGNAGTLSTNLKDYQSQQTKGNLSPSQTTSWLADNLGHKLHI